MRTITFLVTLFAALLAATSAQAAYPVTCQDGTTIYIPQAGDPICKQFTCEPVGRTGRFQDFAASHGMTVSQIWQFEIPAGKGTLEHPAGTAPNILGGWTVVGELPNWRHIRNADNCIDTVAEMTAIVKSGRNLQGALRHDIPSAVVVVPSEPNPCLDSLAECSAAYERTNKVAAAVKICTAGQLFDPTTSMCVARPISGPAAPAPVMSAADAATLGTVKHCAELYDSATGQCVSRAQISGESEPNVLAIVGWSVAGLLFVVVLALLYLLFWRRMDPHMERFEAEVRGEPEVNQLRTEVSRLRTEYNSLIEILNGLVSIFSQTTKMRVSARTLIVDAKRIVAKLQRVGEERDAGRADARAKQVALDAADERNAELSEKLRAYELEVPVQPAVDLTPLAARAMVLLRRRDVEPESNGERDAPQLAAAVLGQFVSEAITVWNERDGLERDLEGTRRGMQEAGVELERVREELKGVEAELNALRAEVAADDKADRDDAQDAAIWMLKQQLEGVGESLRRDIADIRAFVVEHPRSNLLRAPAIAAVERLQAAAARLAPPAN